MSNQLWGDLDIWLPRSRNVELESTTIGATYRPTLVVGLGGTGCKIVRKLRRLVQQLYGPEGARVFQFAVIDTDGQDQSDPDQLPIDIFLNVARPFIPITKMVEAMHAHGLHEFLREWWPYFYPKGDAPQPYRPTYDISEGAHAVRPVGRSALFFRVYEVEKFLRANWDKALNARNPEIFGAATSGKVYIVCSLAGGTGSGMFIDTAYILRKITHDVKMAVYSTAFLLMDTTPFAMYAPEPSIVDRMQANVYAALSELDYYMRGQPSGKRSLYNWRITDTLEFSSNEEPFDLCYLLGVSNENGLKLPDLDSICNMVAEAIYLEVATPLGQKGGSVLDNVASLDRSTSFPLKKGKVQRRLAFSGFSVSSLLYPRDLVAEYCARELTFRVIDRMTRSAQPESPEQLAVAETVDRLNQPAETMPQLAGEFTVKSILDYLKRGKDGRPLDLRPIALSVDMNLQDEIASAHAVLDEIRKHIDRRKLDCVNEYQQTILKSVVQLFARDLGGATYEAITDLTAMVTDLNTEIKKAADTTESTRQDCLDLAEQVDGKIQEYQGLQKKDLKKRQRVLEELSQVENDNLSSSRAQVEYDAAVFVLNHLSARIDVILGNLQRLLDEWGKQRSRIKETLMSQKGKSPSVGPYALGFCALTPQGLQTLVNLQDARNSNVRDQTTQALCRMLENALCDESGDAIQSLPQLLHGSILAFVKSSPEISRDDLFEIIRKCESENQNISHAGIDIAIKRLAAFVPFWNFREDLFPESQQLAAMSVIGFESTQDKQGKPAPWSERLQQRGLQYTQVSHGVRDKLILLQTKHGAPAYAIAAHNETMRAVYKQFMTLWKRAGNLGAQPVHLTSEWCNGNVEDMDPRPFDSRDETPETEKAKRRGQSRRRA